MRSEKQPSILCECVILAIVALFIVSCGCVYLPRCEEIHYKSVVAQDEANVRDVLAETASPLGGEIGYNP